MDFYMLRSFDHAGYYETRLILMVAGLIVAGYFARRHRDYRFLVMFFSGVVFQSVMEYTLQLRGMRGPDYSLSVFGLTLAGIPGRVYQGCVEGGILSLMGFWFVARRADAKGAHVSNDKRRDGYLAVCGLIVALALVVGVIARNRPISSPRPMFTQSSSAIVAGIVLVSIFLAWWKNGLRRLGLFYVGLLIYIVLTFEPMHVLGARYIGVRDAARQFVPAPAWLQVVVMFLSHVWEVAGGKIHYFAVPFSLGLLNEPSGLQPVAQSVAEERQ